MGVDVGGGSVGVRVETIIVAVGGTGVGVSGMIKRVAARQASVESKSGRIHKKVRDLFKRRSI